MSAVSLRSKGYGHGIQTGQHAVLQFAQGDPAYRPPIGGGAVLKLQLAPKNKSEKTSVSPQRPRTTGTICRAPDVTPGRPILAKEGCRSRLVGSGGRIDPATVSPSYPSPTPHSQFSLPPSSF